MQLQQPRRGRPMPGSHVTTTLGTTSGMLSGTLSDPIVCLLIIPRMSTSVYWIVHTRRHDQDYDGGKPDLCIQSIAPGLPRLAEPAGLLELFASMWHSRRTRTGCCILPRFLPTVYYSTSAGPFANLQSSFLLLRRSAMLVRLAPTSPLENCLSMRCMT